LTRPQAELQEGKNRNQRQQQQAYPMHPPAPGQRFRDTNASRAGYPAAVARCSSMRSNWLYLATRSLRPSEPVLICVAVVATAMSAMVVSSVSPERCETPAASPT